MIQIDKVSKSYNRGKTFVVKNVSLNISKGETLVILGSSGSGKTTLLKMINRQILPSSGVIKLHDKNLQSYTIEELRKAFGYVFQGIGLFPHMTVEKNIVIVLELMKKSLKEREARAHELLELVGLNPEVFAKRFPDELSGGQQQRVGVARALAANPECLLMDEPFGALDAITRNTLQDEMIRLNSKLNKTVVFVTHDIHEAFKIADRIAVMHQGEIQQVNNKNDLMSHPKTEFVKALIEMSLEDKDHEK